MHRLAFLATALAFATTAAHAVPKTYVLDESHTAVTWHIDHFGFSSPSGKFMSASGTVVLDQANPAASAVELTIDVSQVNTGVPKLDEHLQTEDFFDTANYPTATFKSTRVIPLGGDTAVVTGDLTLKGHTRPITLNVRLNKLAKNFMDKQTAGFSATGTLKRSDFGMTSYVPDLGDQIKLDIEAEATLTSPQ